MKCPKCGREFERLLALSRVDNKTMICDECGMREALESVPELCRGCQGCPKCGTTHPISSCVKDHPSPDYGKAPQERTKAAVMKTGNRWAIENFNATHS